MVYLKIDELLKNKKKSKYWLVKNMEGNYRTINNMIEKETISIRFDTLEKMCDIFDCEISDVIFRKKGKNKK